MARKPYIKKDDSYIDTALDMMLVHRDDYNGVSIKLIAETCGCSRGKIQSIEDKALNKIREAWGV